MECRHSSSSVSHTPLALVTYWLCDFTAVSHDVEVGKVPVEDYIITKVTQAVCICTLLYDPLSTLHPVPDQESD